MSKDFLSCTKCKWLAKKDEFRKWGLETLCQNCYGKRLKTMKKSIGSCPTKPKPIGAVSSLHGENGRVIRKRID